jgi:hypothetical protein
MDVNYSRWMSKDPDAEPDVIEPEPRRFTLPRPTGSVVASGALVAAVALGGGALVRSIATSDVSANQAQTAESPTAEASDGPGAAGVEDSTSNDSTYDDSTEGEPTSDIAVDDDPTVYRSAPGAPQLRDRRELHQSDDLPAGEPWPDRPPRAHRELAPPPPMYRSRP